MGYQEERRALGETTLQELFKAPQTRKSTPLLNSKREFVLHFAVYAGWPKASRILGVARDVQKTLAEGRTMYGG